MTMRDTVQASLSKKVAEELALDPEVTANLALVDLRSVGLDSLGLVKLLVWIEDVFNIELDDEDLIPSNIESVQSISRVVSAHLDRKSR